MKLMIENGVYNDFVFPIGMEVMDLSLDKFYPLVFSKGSTKMPENIIAKIAYSVIII